MKCCLASARSVAARFTAARALLLLGAIGCAATPGSPERFEVVVRAADPHDQGVEGVRMWADGRDLGITDDRGRLQTVLRGRSGQRVVLSFACPPSYRTDAPERNVLLGRIEGGSPRALELSTHCEPIEHRALIAVRVRGTGVSGVPLAIDGETVGQTDAEGAAHIVVSSRPRGALHVQLITDRSPALLPRNPVRSFEVVGEDEILLFDEELSEAPKRRPRPRAAAGRKLPYRID